MCWPMLESSSSREGGWCVASVLQCSILQRSILQCVAAQCVGCHCSGRSRILQGFSIHVRVYQHISFCICLFCICLTFVHQCLSFTCLTRELEALPFLLHIYIYKNAHIQKYMCMSRTWARGTDVLAHMWESIRYTFMCICVYIRWQPTGPPPVFNVARTLKWIHIPLLFIPPL